MAHLESLKDIVSPEMVKDAATTLGEDKSKLSSAISLLVPVLLGKMIEKGDNNQVREIVEEGGRRELLGKKSELYQGRCVPDDMTIGERLENALVGSNNSALAAAVASESGISKTSASRFTTWIAATVAAYFGDKMVRGNKAYSSLISELKDEKDYILGGVPANVLKAVGLQGVAKAAADGKTKTTTAKKKNNNWIWWLLTALLAILVIFFSVRSCNKNRMKTIETITETPAPVEAADRIMINEMITITLPSGESMSVKKDGAEDMMFEYLNSGKYKDASMSDLRSRWYHFNDIDFMHDSATEMTAGSMTQLNNLAKILKAFPDAKVRIGGYADKTGTNAINMEISKERAAFIKSTFVSDGVAASRISTEGFGEEFATVPVDATDAQRAIDRHIAIRFDK